MNETQPELTSALLDGELDSDMRRQVVSTLTGQNQEEMERFGRYCLIGDAIRGEATILADSVVKKVHEALLDEPVVLAPPKRRSTPWLRPVAGVAVAASVAVAAVFVAPQLVTQTETDAKPVQVAAGIPLIARKPVLVAAESIGPRAPSERKAPLEQWQALTPNLEDRLNRLVIEHHEFGGRTGINGPVPHIGLVSYGAR